MRGQPPTARVPLAVVIALVRSAVVAGADVRSAVEGVAVALEGLDADAPQLAMAARRLGVGMEWSEAWADVPERCAPLERALRGAWRAGASPVGALDAAADSVHAKARAAGDAAAAELGVKLTLPLALCFLPAFVVVGILPLLVTIAGGVIGAVNS